MNMRITDLMDYYRGEPVKALLRDGGSEKQTFETKPVSHGWARKPLMAAAMLLLLVTAGAVLTLMMSRTGGGTALEQGSEPPESVLETVSPEVPAVVPESSAEEPGVTAENQNDIEPFVIEGSFSGEVWDNPCYGNLLYIGNLYYTLTDNGPEQVELQNLTTTVELLGSVWNIDVDYAVIDGELAFHDNMCTLFYAEVDGETVYRGFYDPERTDIEWTDPKAATVHPLEGSTDTVILTIEETNLGDYACLCNLTTGEVTDPLSHVAGLWEHGQIITIVPNSTFTYALIWTEGNMKVPYLCDLAAGEMKLMPQGNGTIYWVDEDTLLLYMQEGQAEEPGMTQHEIAALEYDCWLIFYNVNTGEKEWSYASFQREQYMNVAWTEDDCVCGTMRDSGGNENYQEIDVESGTVYTIPGEVFRTMLYGSEGKRNLVIRTDDSFESIDLCLVDHETHSWADLSGYLEQWDAMHPDIVIGDWMVFTKGNEETRFYRIPDDLPMMPMEAK